MIGISRSLRAVLALSIVAAVTLTGLPASAFATIDGAGIETRDTASGGPSPTAFRDLAATCYIACRIEVGDDEIIPIAPPAGQPDWPFHWSSDLSTRGIAGGSDAEATLWLDSNGLIAFQRPPGSLHIPAPLPSLASPNAMIAGVWTDLDPSRTRLNRGIFKQIIGTAPDRLLYLQWNDVPDFPNTCTSFNFEFVLSETDNSVTVHYRDNRCSNRTAVGGQESSTGTIGTTYFNGTSIPDNISVRYKDVAAPHLNAPAVSCSIGGTNGWCRSATNTVTITDDGDLGASAIGVGVKTRAWKLGAASQGAYISGAANTVTRPDGTHSATGTATDWAGNFRTSAATALKIDTVAPGLTSSLSPAKNAEGWNKTDVSVTWTCTDATSGVAPCPPSTIGGEGIDLTTTRTIVDMAGNVTSKTTAPVNIDRTPPVVSNIVKSPPPNAEGWNNTPVTLTWDCSDALSGAVSTTGSLVSEGLGGPAQATCTDRAGNSATTYVEVLVDQDPPTVATQYNGGLSLIASSSTDILEGTATDASGFDKAGSGLKRVVVRAVPLIGGLLGAPTTILSVDCPDSPYNLCRTGWPFSVTWHWKISTASLQPDMYQLTMHAVDRAGNLSEEHTLLWQE